MTGDKVMLEWEGLSLALIPRGMWLREILEKYNFSAEERALVHTHTNDQDKSRVVADLILAKKIESAAERVITSNETQTKSNAQFTTALVFFAFIQLVVEIYDSSYPQSIKVVYTVVVVILAFTFLAPLENLNGIKQFLSRLQGFVKKLWPWKRKP